LPMLGTATQVLSGISVSRKRQEPLPSPTGLAVA
jgi:hypothetical protein